MDEHRKRVHLFVSDYGKFVFSIFSCCVIAVSLIIIAYDVMPKKLRVSFLDIGQGDAIFIQTPSGHDMLIDGGPNDRVLSKLNAEMNYFNRDIDVVIATHGDADHVTGLIPVLEKYDVKNIVKSPVEAHTGIFDDLQAHVEHEDASVHIGRKGDVIDFHDGVVAYILYPTQFTSLKLDTNDASVSVVIKYGEHSFLLTGDLPSKYEPLLIQKNVPKHVTVYKAGHHGSKTSSGIQLLTYIKPEYAVISAGADNKYGHPSPEAIARLEKYSKEILSTISRGTITFVSDGRNLEVEAEK